MSRNREQNSKKNEGLSLLKPLRKSLKQLTSNCTCLEKKDEKVSWVKFVTGQKHQFCSGLTFTNFDLS